MSNVKNNGQVFTPSRIVNLVLNSVGYISQNIRTKKIMEPSFGDGAFLMEIIQRIIYEVKNPDEIKKIVLRNVFGIEQDKILYQITIQKLTQLLNDNHVFDIDFSSNLICGNTLEVYKRFEKQFDFIVGNPPYVRIHNIQERDKLKEFAFASGNTDLYVLFYEIGLNMLNASGKLGFITPNSFLKNSSQKSFRNHLIENQYLENILDFKSFKVFPKADTYTCICVLNKAQSSSIQYSECVEFSDDAVQFNTTTVSIKEFMNSFIDKPWNLSSKENMEFLRRNNLASTKIQDIANVQNGIATLRDNIFIGKVWEDASETVPYYGKHTDNEKIVYFNRHPIESQMLRRCVKASKFDGTLSNQYILYPYHDTVPISEDELKDKLPNAYQYLLLNKNELLKRDMEKNRDWFLFGRSQGLLHSNQEKLTFKHIIYRENPEIKAWILDRDIIVYSGMFVTGKNLEKIKNIFESADFAKYCSLTGKDMAGGYRSVSTKFVKEYGINVQ